MCNLATGSMDKDDEKLGDKDMMVKSITWLIPRFAS
jgi:hypothetical protein